MLFNICCYCWKNDNSVPSSSFSPPLCVPAANASTDILTLLFQWSAQWYQTIAVLLVRRHSAASIQQPTWNRTLFLKMPAAVEQSLIYDHDFGRSFPDPSVMVTFVDLFENDWKVAQYSWAFCLLCFYIPPVCTLFQQCDEKRVVWETFGCWWETNGLSNLSRKCHN